MNILCKGLMILPLWAMYETGYICRPSFWIASACAMGVCLWDGADRGCRSPRHVILGRAVGMTMAVVLPMNYLVPVMNIWVAVLACYFAVFLLCGFLLVTGLFTAGVIIATDAEYTRWQKGGFHYFWDVLPEIINPDSQLLRSTGMAEPAYGEFVPPPDWAYPCPKCGARVQSSFGVCWNCDYGADGDASAYVKRYGAPPA